jgi:GNAT superfamily N-acetyltransferase
MNITPATPSDLETVITFREEAVEWLQARGIDQWSTPFPPGEIMATIRAGDTWLVYDGSNVAATITLTDQPYPGLWTPEELIEPSLYFHKLTVRRKYGGQGLGVEIINWALGRGYDLGRRWLRCDAWSTNTALHDYYRHLGFTYLRTVSDPPNGVSGALFQRRTAPYRSDLIRNTDRPEPRSV